MSRNVLMYSVAVLAALISSVMGHSQTFVKITDTSNPIVTQSAVSNGSYRGASWIDFDGDLDDDLYVTGNSLYRNDGNGQFVRHSTAIVHQTGTIGSSWADMDNDGDVDCFVAGLRSMLYRNDGMGSFSRVLTGSTMDSIGNRGWSCAWGDYDEDGFVDLVVAHPANFVGTPTTNHFLRNQGNGTLSKLPLDSIGLDTSHAPYTVVSWSDFDLDGDLDLFFGSGPASGSPGPDYLYRNRRIETGTALFQRITEGVIASDLRDGQIINWIDYDNDSDLDCFITNYGMIFPNDLYRNDQGTYVKMIVDSVGSIVSDAGLWLSSVWADFDNDGDLDCLVTSDLGIASIYYVNNGNGTFSRYDAAGLSAAGPRFSACAGDYDLDGRMDVYISGNSSSKALYHNETMNSNHWTHVRLVGDPQRHSNRAAIGARVRCKATINGVMQWQMREVSSQNTFNGQSSLTVHFGLGDASIIDSLVIEWPSDSVEVYTGLGANHFYTMTEGQGYTVVAVNSGESAAPQSFELRQNFPNPFNPSTTIRFSLNTGARIQLKVYNLLGQEVRTLVNQTLSNGEHTVTWDGRDDKGTVIASGVYIYRLTNGTSTSARKMLFIK